MKHLRRFKKYPYIEYSPLYQLYGKGAIFNAGVIFIIQIFNFFKYPVL